jgi:hypothetical protein
LDGVVSASRRNLVVYTTIYSEVERYLPAWSTSLWRQTDRDFDVWVNVDSIAVDDVLGFFPSGLRPQHIIRSAGKSPTQIRIEAIEQMVDNYSAVVFVDADDLLHPTRVEGARHFLKDSDVVGCALELVDEDGREIGATFGPETGEDPASLLPTYNVFGLSNTAYRSDVLRGCLPLSSDTEMIDWQLATLAFTRGARLAFDYTPRMYYRQHAQNFANVSPPFTARQVSLAATRILAHYSCLLDGANDFPSKHRNTWRAARTRAEAFNETITRSNEKLNRYVQALNRLKPRYVWGWCVAHPQLEGIWRN